MSRPYDTVRNAFRRARGLPVATSVLRGHTHWTNSVTFLPNSKQVISGSLDGSVRAWWVRDGREVGTVMKEGGQVQAVAVSRDGQWIASGGQEKTVTIWKATTHEKVKELEGHSDCVLSLAFSPDSATLVSGSLGGMVIVWSTTTGERLTGPLKEHTRPVWSVSYSPKEGDEIASCDGANIQIWNCLSGILRITLTADARSLAWTPNGQRLIAGCYDGSIKLFNSSTGSLLSGWNGHSHVVWSLTTSPDGKFIASGSWDNRVCLWDTTTSTQIGHTLQHYDPVNCVAISPDGSHLVSGGCDNKIHIWSLQGIIPPFVLENTPMASNDAPTTHPLREAQNSQSAKDHGNNKNVTEKDNSVRSSSGRNVLSPAQKKDVSFAEGLPSKPVPVPPKIMRNGKAKDLGPSGLFAGDGDASSGSSIDKTSTAFGQPTTWNLGDIRSSFPNDLTGHVTREGEHPVASGSFGDVYRGTFRVSGRLIDVAVKAIRTYSIDDGDYALKKKRLRREIRVWLNLEHTNVLPFFGTTMGFGQFAAMVCPWIEGGPLTSYLERRDDNLTTVERLVLLGDVAMGLQYLHSQSVVHGDLSGLNVLIRDNGRACIADFGLSMLLTELDRSIFSTSFQTRGTLRWAAPELQYLNIQVSSDEDNLPRVPPTPQSDIYSFGGIMLQVLTGKIPYHYYPRDERVLLALSQGETPTRPSQALVTDGRWTFIQRCWTSVDAGQSRPSGEEIAEFTRNELVQAVLHQR
ncbi:WD40 repeat-like protein [Gyrodon lividus]|nr:WD40 repeat-like protein [Gyrodon lividus]